MRSEPRATGTSPFWVLLRSQGLGVCCGLATVLLLAVGSVVLAATRDTASAMIALDDVSAFFVEPSLAHLWFYLLIPVMTLYAANTALATWHNVMTRWRAGMRAPQLYAAAFIHVAFLIAMIAHLVGGLGSRETGAVLGDRWTPLSGATEARLVSLDIERLPNGAPKATRAGVELRSADGSSWQAVLGYNEPISSGWGSDLVLLQQPISIGAALLASGEERCRLTPGRSCSLAGREIRLLDLRGGGAHGAMANVAIGDQSGWIVQGRELIVEQGLALALLEVKREAAVAVRLRHAPGNPWALVSAILLILGIGLMWRRFV